MPERITAEDLIFVIARSLRATAQFANSRAAVQRESSSPGPVTGFHERRRWRSRFLRRVHTTVCAERVRERPLALASQALRNFSPDRTLTVVDSDGEFRICRSRLEQRQTVVVREREWKSGLR